MIRKPRSCGYCGDVGHWKPKCPVVLEQRTSIHRHLIEEPQRIHALLCKAGFGQNALLDYNVLRHRYKREDRDVIPCQVLSYNEVVKLHGWSNSTWDSSYFEQMLSNHRRLVRTVKVKYSKKVTVDLLGLTTDLFNYMEVDIPVLKLDGTHQIQMMPVEIGAVYAFANQSKASEYRVNTAKGYIAPCLLAPSYDVEQLKVPARLLTLADDSPYLHERLWL